jgi:hypothetical protein
MGLVSPDKIGGLVADADGRVNPQVDPAHSIHLHDIPGTEPAFDVGLTGKPRDLGDVAWIGIASTGIGKAQDIVHDAERKNHADVVAVRIGQELDDEVHIPLADDRNRGRSASLATRPGGRELVGCCHPRAGWEASGRVYSPDALVNLRVRRIGYGPPDQIGALTETYGVRVGPKVLDLGQRRDGRSRTGWRGGWSPCACRSGRPARRRGRCRRPGWSPQRKGIRRIRHAVGVGIGVVGIKPPPDLVAVLQAIAVCVVVQGIGTRFVDLDPIGQAIPVGIAIPGQRVELKLLRVGQSVPVIVLLQPLGGSGGCLQGRLVGSLEECGRGCCRRGGGRSGLNESHLGGICLLDSEWPGTPAR